MTPLIAVFTGIGIAAVLLAFIAAAGLFIAWATSRNVGSYCDICTSPKQRYTIGEVSKWTDFVRSIQHEIIARRRWHRQALGDLWRDRQAKHLQNLRWNDRWML